MFLSFLRILIIMLVYNLNRYYLYVEGVFFLIHGRVGSFKSKCPLGIHLYFADDLVDTHSLPLITNSKLFQISYSLVFFEMLSQINYKVSYGNFFKLRVRGRGYKIIKDVNSLVLRLGYSHKIAYLVSLPILMIPHRRMRRNVTWRVYGLCADVVRNACYVIHSFRKPDIYCKLGIYLYGKEVIFKQGVKPYRL